ncbi:MAG: phosphoesterase [Chitinophagaceae bacterium]|nr:phosphoesterase [Chitinophagaceae bacterium]
MGNHEFNAICFHKPHVESGGFFRNHSYTEISQHLETLKQFQHYPNEWETFLQWFETLPMWFENDDFRVVHAYWDDAYIQFLDQCDKTMSADFLKKATDKKTKTKEYLAVEAILKGIEEDLPDGRSFSDKDGNIRKECRVKWWALPENRKTMNDYLLECPEEIKSHELSDGVKNKFTYTVNKPVLFGHYWLKGIPTVENERAICLDYSIAKGGKLLAYSIDSKKLTYT